MGPEAVITRQAAAPPFPRLSLLLGLLAAASVVAVVLSGPRVPGLGWLERWAGDVRSALYSQRTDVDHSDIVLVNISDTSLPAGVSRAPIDRAFLAELIEAVDASSPRSIGLDMTFGVATDPVRDRSLQQALQKARARVVLGQLGPEALLPARERSHHNQFVAATGRASGTALLQPDPDGAVRLYPMTVASRSDPDGFALQLARSIRPDAQPIRERISWLQKVDHSLLSNRFMNVYAQAPFRIIPAEDLVDQLRRGRPMALGGKIALIGAVFDPADLYRTALTAWTGELMPSHMIQAQVISQLIDDRMLDSVAPATARLGLFALGCMAALIGWRSRHHVIDIFGSVLFVALLLAIDGVVFSNFMMILPVVSAFLVWYLGSTAGHHFGRVHDWEERHGQRWP